MKRVHVAAAVIRGADGRVLIARRPDDKHQGGLWEFPGGKVEGEAVQAALSRELEEELGIRVSASRPLIQVHHDYPDKQVLLDVWEVTAFDGEPHGAEGQPLAWASNHELGDYQFPAANQPIVAAARLPDRYLITPDELEPQELLQGVRAALAEGAKLIQLRAPNMFDAQYRDLAVDIQGLCARRAQLMLKGPLEWLGTFPPPAGTSPPTSCGATPPRPPVPQGALAGCFLPQRARAGAGDRDGRGLRHPVAPATHPDPPRSPAAGLGRCTGNDPSLQQTGVPARRRRPRRHRARLADRRPGCGGDTGVLARSSLKLEA